MRRCLIFNPVARGGKAKSLGKHLKSVALECDLCPTTGPGGGRVLAANAVKEGVEMIIAAGGDGTVNEVLNGMGDIPGGFERVRLGVLPIGTINVFARELGLPREFGAAWTVLQRGREEQIDLPYAEFFLNGRSERRFFVQLAGAGLDSRAIELVSWKLKQKIGPLAYIVAGVKAFLEKHPQITLNEAGGAAGNSGELVLIGNGRFYGGSHAFFPKAKLTDGLLDVCVFPKIRWNTILRAAFGMAVGDPNRFGRVIQFQTSEFYLKCASKTMLELDGENVGELPSRISLLPKGLRIIVP